MLTKPKERSSSEAEAGNGHSLSILKILDTIAKLLAAGAVVAVTFIANSYQSKMTGLSLLSQREQAETQLRATMFSNLISPIAGPHKESAEITPEREKLLVEILALNFHENFELKPLLEHVNKRLANEKERESLRSIARRIIDRQIASLLKEGAGKDITELMFIESPQLPKDKKDKWQEEYSKSLLKNKRGKQFGDFYSVKSPDRIWIVDLTITGIDKKKDNVEVLYNIKSKSSEKIGRGFRLTPFDFPLTDNTLFADGNRFAVVLDSIDIDKSSKMKTVALRLIWFPKDYFTPRERPINYANIRNKLGFKHNK